MANLVLSRTMLPVKTSVGWTKSGCVNVCYLRLQPEKKHNRKKPGKLSDLEIQMTASAVNQSTV